MQGQTLSVIFLLLPMARMTKKLHIAHTSFSTLRIDVTKMRIGN